MRSSHYARWLILLYPFFHTWTPAICQASFFCTGSQELIACRVKANRGAAGVDDQSIEEFGGDLENNLYRRWNRLASGSYMSLPVAKRYLETILEPLFHGDFYYYRPGRSHIKHST